MIAARSRLYCLARAISRLGQIRAAVFAGCVLLFKKKKRDVVTSSRLALDARWIGEQEPEKERRSDAVKRTNDARRQQDRE
jgi:hypothetical protein